MTSNLKSQLASAIDASKKNNLFEWTLAYLQSEERNKELVENIQKRKIVKIELIEYPLSKLEKVTGLQNGETEPEPLHQWVNRVKKIEDAITKKHLPPPI